MAQQLSLDTAPSTVTSSMVTSSMVRHTTKSARRPSMSAHQAPAADHDDEGANASSGRKQGAAPQSDKLRLVGLAGVARAREALAEATKRAEQRQLHEAA
ncbi:MAG TPA: hypothetical protein VFN61_07045 [Acidimicrobiales bacterium]|nr:hypothetical protein [Acidimicrobiales bacterium]